MTMSPKDFSMLQSMQQLCTKLEQDIEQIAKFNGDLQATHHRYEELSALYHTHWQRLAESKTIDEVQKQQIEAMVADGSYSVFGQDTVWNALTELHTQYVELLKTLVQKI